MGVKVHKSKNTLGVKSENHIYFYYGLLFLLFYPPFFRGLFFQSELLPTHILSAILFLLYVIMNKEDFLNQKFHKVEIAFLGLMFAYGISSIVGVNKNLAIAETLKYINYGVLIILAKRLVNGFERLNKLLIALVSAGVLVVFIGIGSALETFQYNGAFSQGMMSSTLQYHNAFGAYCLAILPLIYVLSNQFTGKNKLILNAAGFIMFFGFILSYSRGAWVLLPVIGFIYYLLVPIQWKKGFITNLLSNASGFLLVLHPFTNVLNKETKAVGWLWVVLGIGVSVGIYYASDKFLEKLNINSKIYTYIIPAMVIVLAFTSIIFMDSILKVLPAELAQRMGSISLGTDTVTERTVFYEDAMKIVKDYPIFGAGGGGWSTLYPYYQTYGYVSSQAHNYYMQLWIEVGTVGLIMFATMFLFYLAYCIQQYRNSKDEATKAYQVGIFSACLTILVHSTIDFDLSLSAMAFLIWGLIGAQLSMTQEHIWIEKTYQKSYPYAAAGAVIVLLLLASTNHLALQAANSGIRYTNMNQLENAQKSFGRARLLNPFDASYTADYANILNAVAYQKKNEQDIEKSIRLMDKAGRMGKYSFDITVNSARFYMRNTQVDKAFEAIHNLEKYHPLNPNTYENKTGLYLTVANHYIEQQNKAEAVALLQEVVETENNIIALNKQIEDTVKMSIMVRFVDISPKTKENIDNARDSLDKLQL